MQYPDTSDGSAVPAPPASSVTGDESSQIAACLSLVVDGRGYVTITCDCGDLVTPLPMRGAVASRLVRGRVASHIGLHATAAATNTPWEAVRGGLAALEAAVTVQDGRQ